MGQCGELVFFSENATLDLKAVVLASLRYVGAPIALRVTECPEGSLSWDAFLAELERPYEIVEAASGAGRRMGTRVPIEEVPALYHDGTYLSVAAISDSFGERMKAMTESGIPESIRNGFFPTDPIITIGRHDVFAEVEGNEMVLFGRAWYSFALFGCGTPHNGKAYREMVFDVPAVKALKADLEAIAGPLKQGVFWSV